MSVKCQLDCNRLSDLDARPIPAPLLLRVKIIPWEQGLTFKLLRRPTADSAHWAHIKGLFSTLSGSKMKRNHNYSSSDSELDDNIEVEKDSADENG